MKNRLAVFVAVVAESVAILSANAQTTYYIAGDFNSWSATGNVMTQITAGVWQAALTNVSAGQHKFKITDGNWSDPAYPTNASGYNAWLFPDSNGNVTVTFNANTVADGWYGKADRIGVNDDPATWIAVGNWQGWNATNPATAMTAIGGGIYEFSTNLPPGAYQYQAVLNGASIGTNDWWAIGVDYRSDGASSLLFTNASAGLVQYNLYVNPSVGIITVSNPPPACTYALGPVSVMSPPAGGTGSITLTAGSACPWAATSNVPWITITSATSGSGSSTINYSVGANTSASGRTGTVTIAYQTFTVNQYCQPLGGAVLDGTVDTNVYGCVPLSVQAIGSSAGQNSDGQIDVANGSALDAGYGRIENGILYLVLAGNLASDYSKLEIFFDTGAPGQNTLTNIYPNVDSYYGSSALEIMGPGGPGGTNGTPGLTFDTNFVASYWMDASCGGSPFTLYANYAQLYPGGAGTNGYNLGQTVGPATNSTLFAGTNPYGIQVAINNINTAGVDASPCYEENGQGSIMTGVELGIPLAALGSPTGAVKVCAFISDSSHNNVSDQVLGPLWDGTGFFCTNTLGMASSVNFANEPGTHYFVVGPSMRVTGITRSGSNINVTWLTGTNSSLVYQLQRTSTLIPASWSNVGSPTNSTGGALTQTDTSATTNSTMFYRVSESIGACP
ncbi:MAG TPA: BACON domain-containing carbohydrate-binding protein [Verrucomicrobiae bacterium]|nr:BACON domain-containing carbohydrate-binding protein [Verrucomicrobiae bacterium]